MTTKTKTRRPRAKAPVKTPTQAKLQQTIADKLTGNTDADGPGRYALHYERFLKDEINYQPVPKSYGVRKDTAAKIRRELRKRHGIGSKRTVQARPPKRASRVAKTPTPTFDNGDHAMICGALDLKIDSIERQIAQLKQDRVKAKELRAKLTA